METQTTVTLTPPVTTTSTTTVPVVEAPVQELDLISKVAQFKKTQVSVPVKGNIDNGVFNYNEIENIKDPIAKEIAIKAYKSLQGDYTRKTQELAEQRKILDAKSNEQPKGWTAQRIQQELLNNPEFLKAAQEISSVQNPPNSGLTNEEFSVLSDGEKTRIAGLEKKINDLERTNANANFYAAVSTEDARLQTRYPDYNPIEINEAMERLASMSPVAVREFVYKAMNHDTHVKDVAEMIRQEGKNLNQDKLNAFSPNGTTTTNTEDVPTKQPGESDMAFMVKLGQFRLAQSKKR